MFRPLRLRQAGAAFATALLLAIPYSTSALAGDHGRSGHGGSGRGGGSHRGGSSGSHGGRSQGSGGYGSNHGSRSSSGSHARGRSQGSGAYGSNHRSRSSSGLRVRDQGAWRESRGHGSGGHGGSVTSPHVRYRSGRSSGVYGGGSHRDYGYRSRGSRHHGGHFSLGVVISSVPRYGYDYYDDYCGIRFRNLGVYLDHTYDYDHPAVIQVLDGSGYPVASCRYDGGAWIVYQSY